MSGMLPLIRLEVEGMRHQMVHALGKHHQELERAVGEEATRFIEGYDFAAATKQLLPPILEQAIQDALTTYYRYGPGKRLIEDAVKAAAAPKKAPAGRRQP